MGHWRRIATMCLAAAIWVMGGGVVWTHGVAHRQPKPKLAIVSYKLVRVERVNRSVREYTFRARLKNRGAAVSGARAVLVHKHADFQIVDGEVTFGPVKAGKWAESTDTFSLRRRGRDGLFGRGRSLRWEITAAAANRPPVAVAGPGSSAAVGQRVRLDGTRSSDPDGDRLKFRWTFVSKPRPSRAVLAGAETATPSFVVDVAGSYVVGLVVSDGQAASDRATTTVVTPNRRPVADAGPDRTAALGARATLSGAASSDPDGDPLTYRWRLESRPAGSAAVLRNASSVESSLVPDVRGRYVVQLVVADGRSESLPDTVVVSTENSPPVARAGADRSASVGEVIRLDGGKSSDVDGGVLRFSWSVVARPAGSAATPVAPSDVAPSVRIDRAGSYRFRLVVSDGKLSSEPDEVAIDTRNTAPVAHAGPDVSAAVGEVVALDGSGSSDADGDALTYAWSLASAPAGSQAAIDAPGSAAPRLAIDRPGTYVAQLIVSDASAASAADTVVITTRNSPPIARAGPDRAAVAGYRVPLDGTASSDPDGDALTFSWALVAVPAGSRAVLENPSSPRPWFVADRDGLYVAQLIVDDGERDSAPDTVEISTTNSRPVAHAGADVLDAPVGAPVTLDGSASSDADGHPLRLRWSLLAAPPDSTAALSDPAVTAPTFVPDRGGEYVIQLVVDDGLLDSAPDTVLVRTANRAPAAAAGADQAVALGSSVALDATGSSDPDGDALSFFWEFVSRPAGSQAALTAPGVGLGAFVADAAGRFVLRLTVTDAAGASASDTLDVDVAAHAHLDVPANLTWPAVQTGDSLEQSVVVTNSGGAAVTGLAASVTGAFVVDPDSSCLADSLDADDTCEILIAFRPTAAGAANGTLTLTSSAPGSPHRVALGGEGRLPSLSAAPATLGFGPTVVGQTSAPTASVIGNDGVGDVEIASVSVSGDFTLAGGAAGRCQVGTVLAPGAACSVTVAFRPTQVGARAGTAVVGARGDGESSLVTRSLTLTGDGAAQPTVTIAASDASASEWGLDPAAFTLSRTGSTAAALTVRYALGGTATSADYAALSGQVTFAAGQSQAVLTVTPVTDVLNESEETVVVTLLGGPDYALGAPLSASATIEDAFQSVSVSATGAVAAESGLQPGAFTFRRVGSVRWALTVNVLVGGTATAGADYQALGSSVVIPAGQSQVVVPVTPLADAVSEPAETVVVTLAAGSYVAGAAPSATVTIEDTVLPRVTVVAIDAAASEVGPEPGVFRFARTGDAGAPMTVRFTVAGSATSGTDFVSLGTSITFAAGQTSVDRAVVPVNDPQAEGPETVTLTLVDDPDYDLGSPASATITIEDQALPLVSVAAVDGDASEAGDTGTLRFTRTGDLTFGLTFTIARGGSATAAADYASIPATLSFGPGQATIDRTLTPLNDANVEGEEDVTVTVLDGASYDVGAPATARITIADQPIPIITVTAIDPVASETGANTGTFRFTRAGDTALALTVLFTRSGTASNGDFAAAALGTSVTFPAGAATVDRVVTPTADALAEGSETVVVTLSDGARYDLGTPATATVTITD